MKYILATLIALMSTTAVAHERHYDPHQSRARVLEVVPRYEFRDVRVHGEVCDGVPVNERGDYRRQYGYQGERRRGDGNAVIGAIVGAAVGSQIGDGNGQVAATAIGAITGAAIGDRRSRDYYERREYESMHHRPRYGYCRMEYYTTRVRVEYYEIYYNYRGYVESMTSYERPRGRYIYIYEKHD